MNTPIALISGGSSGLGKSIAKRYLQANIQVIIIGRRKSKLQSTQQELQQYGTIHTQQCDISNTQDIHKLSEYLQKKFTHLDILINNASILGALTEIENYPLQTWQDVINTNINGTFYLSKTCIPLLKKGTNPIIFNVSSSVGKEGRAKWGAYSVSKFALEGFSQILGKELTTSPIRVYSINPGAMKTSMRKSAYPKENPQTLTYPDTIAELFIELLTNHEQCKKLHIDFYK